MRRLRLYNDYYLYNFFFKRKEKRIGSYIDKINLYNITIYSRYDNE